jgi:hypothetical protein
MTDADTLRSAFAVLDTATGRQKTVTVTRLRVALGVVIVVVRR